MSRAQVLGRGLLAAAAALVLTSCTVSGGAGQPSPAPGSSTDATVAAPSEAPSQEPSPSGIAPAELSAQLLAGAEETVEPLGTVTAVVPIVEAETVLDVLEVERLQDGTFVSMQLSTTGETYGLGLTTFSDARFGSRSFVRDVYLDDESGGVRYLPLQFEDYRDACVCPYKPFVVGPEPQVLHAVFPALPDGVDTVTLRLADSDLVLESLPVGG